MNNVFIVAAKRTPFGSFGGSLSKLSATELGAISTKAAIASASNLDPSLIGTTFFGNCIQSSPDAAYLARHVALKSGIPILSPAMTINRLCGSGFESVRLGVASIQLNEAEISVCGGTENMSAAPYSINGNDVRFGVKLGSGLNMYDSLWSGLTDTLAGIPMGVTAENLAEKYGITREECDEYALRSQKAWGEAQSQGIFKSEMAPIEIETKKGQKVIDTDEHPRPDTQKEKLSTLPTVFKKNGTVTAANASGICDGAGTIILASEEATKKYNLTPMARIASHAVVGCDPQIMGIGPAPAMRNALQKLNLELKDMDRIEINEAFAAQYLAVEKELELDRSKVNINGGAISLGHPLAASGSRILAHLANDFQKNDKMKYAIASACIGGGQGIAIILERVL